MLTPAEIEAIARDLVVLAARSPQPLMTVAETARMLNMSEDWVRMHTVELGGSRLGDGSKGELRFDRALVQRAIDARRVRHLPLSASRSRKRTGRRAPGGVPTDTKDW